MTTPGDRLDSWKPIADYLGRDRRTLMRWERTAGLPIRRVGAGRGGSVFAYKSEIDQWLARHAPDAEPAAPAAPGPPPSTVDRRFGRLPPIATAAIVLVAVLTGVAVTAKIPRTPGDISSAVMKEGELIAYDARHRELWRVQKVFSGRVGSGPRFAIADIDDDGRADVVGTVQVEADDGNEGDGLLFAVDHTGRLRWQQKLDGRYRFGDTEYGPGWFAEDVLVYRTTAGPRIAVAEHHHTWWPSIVSTFDGEGHRVGTYVNAGWVRRLKLTRDGRYILAAGISNAHGGAMLAVLDATNPSGASPADGGNLPACVNCPPGSPAHFFVIPWSALARPADTPPVSVSVVKDGTIEWRALQRADGSPKIPETIVTLSATLEVRERNVDDYFVDVHDQLDRAGELNEHNSDWRHPVVREWTPERGWREIR